MTNQQHNTGTQPSAFVAIAIIVIVVHGLGSKLLAWLQSSKEEKDICFDEYDGKNKDKEEFSTKHSLSEEEMVKESNRLLERVSQKCALSEYGEEKVSIDGLKNVINSSVCIPSFKNNQPWSFSIIKNKEVKDAISGLLISEVATVDRTYISKAACFIIAFKVNAPSENVKKFNEISTHMACGALIAALRSVGFYTTPIIPTSKSAKISYLLNRPMKEACAMVIPVGHPAKLVKVADNKEDFITII